MGSRPSGATGERTHLCRGGKAREFKDTTQQAKNVRRYMGGFNYYISQQNLKITGARERIVPNVSTPATALTKNTNHFVVQLRFYYF